MTRIPYPDAEALDPQAAAALEQVPPLNVFRLLALAGPALPRFLRLTGGLWSDAELSPRRRELAILHVARLVGSEYEWHQHTAVAAMCDITEAQIAAIAAGDLDAPALEAADRTLLEFVGVIVRRERAGEALFGAARAILSDREIVELHLVVAIYAGLGALMTNLDLDLDEQQGAALLERDARGPRLGE
jgi:alkylhydroperoxidase family enzyme